MTASHAPREALALGQRRALIVGVVALAATGLGAFLDLDRALQAWLYGWFFWLGLALGSLAVLLLHHTTGGAWGYPIRRMLEAATRTLPLLGILFLPVLALLPRLYPWAADGALDHDPLLAHKGAYLNVPFFVLRSVVYFAIWLGLAAWMRRLGAKQDETGHPSWERRIRRLAGPGLAVYVLSMTFASIDWGMSLEPHWFSTIYGVIFVVGQVLSALALAVLGTAWLARREPYREWISRQHFHDLGNLVFAFVLLWAYVSFSQYLIIWSGNLAEEAPWYANRLGHGWQAVSVALLGFHFFVPFAVLLSRKAKRSGRALALVAGGLLVMRFVDLYWLVQPAFRPDGIGLHWLDVAAPIALGGLWSAAFFRGLRGRPLLVLEGARAGATLERGSEEDLRPNTEGTT